MVPSLKQLKQQPSVAEDRQIHSSISEVEFPGWGEENPGEIEGYIDLIDGERVVGWVYDAASPGRRLLIQVSSGSMVKVAVANIDRQDLRDAGKGDGRHGFEVKFNFTLNHGGFVHVKVIATGLDLRGSPAQLNIVELITHPTNEKALECLRSEALLTLLSLKGSNKQ